MALLEADIRLSKLGRCVLTTRDAAAILSVTIPAAAMTLLRLNRAGRVLRLTRGRWAIPDELDPLAVPEHLTAPWPSYVSLQTALYRHGMISQIPVVTYAVSLARTRRWPTPLGVFSIHHIGPDFFFGFDTVGRSLVKLATPEKALLDIFYLSPAKSGLFRKLPELELPRKKFSVQKAREMAARIRSPSRRTLVITQLEQALEKTRRG